MVYIDGQFKGNLEKGITNWTEIGLLPGTQHTIITRTVDLSGNANSTLVSSTDMTDSGVNPLYIDVELPQSFTPGSNNTIEVSVANPDGLADLRYVNCTAFRNSTGYTSCDSPEDHYSFIYNVTSQTITSNPASPTPYFKVLSNISTSLTSDTLEVNFKPEHYALPSKDTNTELVNSYVWKVRCSAQDSALKEYAESYTEMDKLAKLFISTTNISYRFQSGKTSLYSPNITFSNMGNVWLDISFSMSDQYYNNYVIGADNCTIDDDPYLNEGEENETGAPQMNYSNNPQTWNINLTTMVDIDNSTKTIYNWINIPALPEGIYIGSVSYEGVESYAR